jgi:CBS domain-containing protein
MQELMNAGEICNRIVAVSDRKMTLVEAARLMRERHVDSLVVVDETGVGRVPVGILSERDIVTKVVAEGQDPTKLLVNDVMSRNLVTALTDDSIKNLSEIMKCKGLRRLPVVSDLGALEGSIALDDLLPLMAAEQLRDMAAFVGAEFWPEECNRP